MKLTVEEDLAKVAEFTETPGPAERLLQVAVALPQLAELVLKRYTDGKGLHGLPMQRRAFLFAPIQVTLLFPFLCHFLRHFLP